jgi:HEAT repeat protein
MTKAGLAIVILAALVAGASSMDLMQHQEEALTPIDTVPSKAQLESLPPGYTVTQTDLEQLAASGSASPALRLRAIHALSTYCVIPPPPAAQTCPDSDTAHQTIASLIIANGSAHSGADLLILRGAIEAIGPMRGSNDAAMLLDLGLLEHPSRDVRATTALALGALCNTTAINALHQRYTNESTDQVKLAISAALRTLSVCVP